MLLAAVDPLSVGDSVSTNITISNKDALKTGESLSEYVDANIQGLINNKQLVKLVSRRKMNYSNKLAEEVILYERFDNVNTGEIFTNILVGHNLYGIVCTVPRKKLSLYANLFNEIIGTIVFKEAKI